MKIKIAILFGGKSAEHEVSLKSATNIFNAVDKTKFEPILLGNDINGDWYHNIDYVAKNVDLTKLDYFTHSSNVFLFNSNGQIQIIEKETNQVLDFFEVAFPIIHGTFGEDGTLQGLLKSLNIPFVGPDVLGSAIAMDKDITKRLLRDANIPIADFYTLQKHNLNEYTFEEIENKLKLPLFIKPANAGSSVGVSKVTCKNTFIAALSEAFKFDNKILIEEAINGKEVECAILGNEIIKASVIGEIIPTKDFYSYDAKYLSLNGAKMKIPADIDEVTSRKIKEQAIKAFKTICCEGMARVDFFLREDHTFVLNEINTLPGFTEISMYPKLWEHSGVEYKNLITELINLAVKRNKRDNDLLTEK
jgi:D-alanine-D-alanine ligase